MATNQNSNKESGAETTKKASASTKKTGTRTSTTRTASSRPAPEKRGPGRPAGSTTKAAASSKTTAAKAPAAKTAAKTAGATTRTAGTTTKTAGTSAKTAGSTTKATATAKPRTTAATRTSASGSSNRATTGTATRTSSVSKPESSTRTASASRPRSSLEETKTDSTYGLSSFYGSSSLFAEESTPKENTLFDTGDTVEKESQSTYKTSEAPDDLIYSTPMDQETEEVEYPEAKKESSKKWPIILTVVGILLLLGIGGFLLANRSEKKEKNPVNTRLEVNDRERGSLVCEQAQNYIFAGDYDQAISLLTGYLADNPNDSEAKELLEQARSRKALQESAQTDILSAYNAYIASGDYSGAIRLIEGADEDELKKQGLDKNFLLDKARSMESAREAINKNDYEGAEKTLEKFLSDYNTSDPDVNNLLAQVRRLLAIKNPRNDYGGQSDIPAFVGMNTPQTNRSTLLANNTANNTANNGSPAGSTGTGTGSQGNNASNNATNSGTGNRTAATGTNAGTGSNNSAGTNAGTGSNDTTGTSGRNAGSTNAPATTNSGSTNSNANGSSGTPSSSIIV